MALTLVDPSMTNNITPTGVVLAFAGSTAPSGWLLCYGQTVSRTTYADLFSAIGTTYGAGDGSTTFGIPDTRGRVHVGKDNMGGTAANRMTSGGAGIDGLTLGASGGTETHTLTTAQMPVHTHTGTTDSQGAHTHTVSSTIQSAPAGTAVTTLGGVGNTTTSSAGAHTHTVTNANAGSGAAHPIVQPTIVFNHIIKT